MTLAAKLPHKQAGVVTMLERRGLWGFIGVDRGSEGVFFHHSDVLGQTPIVGDRVSFHLGHDARGRLRAENVEVLP